jgi:hypothetical protein
VKRSGRDESVVIHSYPQIRRILLAVLPLAHPASAAWQLPQVTLVRLIPANRSAALTLAPPESDLKRC